ncbi:hypothetical protein SOVF_193390 [Spinacia oleracea]|uniref:Charged multivesicular body protein 7 n=1 Tax=Spinacia oleracea TaxID=3562 RepID=A0A9R0JLC2_SPIOL|nr:uncharacterized protein LOC110778626 [Spinacia oleracea]XP_021838869.2 uncharacterized protein LOC110778626 [Spinacia oleracea]KNA05113.1 hypothetical protein SOVF_193390 [Spinacia oleracea]
MAEELKVVEFIREQVPDWDDDVKATARFKAFSGQRSDWESQFFFWRDLIIKIAREFDLLFLSPSQMKNCWFNRGGLSPLCLNDSLLEMYKAGNVLRVTDFGDPTSGRLSQLLKKLIHFSIVFRPSTSNDILNDRLILRVMLEEKSADVIKALSETHWTSSCIITMRKFESLFREHNEAYAVLCYLSGYGKARYISVKRKEELIEGVKVSLSSAAAPILPSTDSAILQLVWTLEELQKQLLVIDEQYKRLRISALAALKSGDKKLALRNARQLKLASESREKLTSLFNRVEEVLRAITDAESAKKVSEAIQLGALALKENRTDVEKVQMCLQELDEFRDSQEIIHNALESTSYTAMEDEDIEEELKRLDSQIRDENLMVSALKSKDDAIRNAGASVTPDSLCAAIVDLKLESETQETTQGPGNRTSLELEAA